MWERGRATVDDLINGGNLERVEASAELADRLMDNAAAHIKSAELCAGHDPTGALQLSYDAVRKSATALLSMQGLRATVPGGHIAALDAVRAQFNDRGGMPVFGQLHQLRRHRNDSEYPRPNSTTVTAEDALHAISVAKETADAARRLIDAGKLGEFL